MEPLQSWLGTDGLTKTAEEILQGTFVFPPVIHPDIIEFFSHMKISYDVMNAPEVNTTTYMEDFCSFWKAGREKIVSSMSKIHNGHYIAATTSIFLATITTTLCSIPWEIGETLKRWRYSLNVALEKKLGIRLLDKLRTIHLLEADYNTGRILIFAQRMMDNAAKLHQIPESQYAKKRSRAIKAVAVKRFFLLSLIIQNSWYHHIKRYTWVL